MWALAQIFYKLLFSIESELLYFKALVFLDYFAIENWTLKVNVSSDLIVDNGNRLQKN